MKYYVLSLFPQFQVFFLDDQSILNILCAFAIICVFYMECVCLVLKAINVCWRLGVVQRVCFWCWIVVFVVVGVIVVVWVVAVVACRVCEIDMAWLNGEGKSWRARVFVFVSVRLRVELIAHRLDTAAGSSRATKKKRCI